MRTLKDYLIIMLKGMGMGAADVVPGVSGGTIAFISGIYEELLSSINSINFSVIKTLKNEGVKAAWNQINGSFLLALFMGIGISVLSLARVFKYLLEHHPILVWGFFFGLILASIIYIGKQISNWNFQAFAGLIIGTGIVLGISMIPAQSDVTNPVFIFVCGMIAICAMILPGISGSFILLVLGAYSTILGAVSEMKLSILAAAGSGALIGLMLFSRFLSWLLKTYHNVTMAVLTGFLIGSLYKVWPWKETIKFRINSHGEQVPFIQENVLPYENVMLAALCCVLGFLLIFGTEFIASKLKKDEN